MGVECAMEKSRRRALRRSHADRKLSRVYRTIANWSWTEQDPVFIRLMARKRRDNMQVCSRPFCCGNPRRVHKNRLERLTMAELRADDAFRDMTLEQDYCDQVTLWDELDTFHQGESSTNER